MGPLPGMAAGSSRSAAGAPGGPDGPREAAGGAFRDRYVTDL